MDPILFIRRPRRRSTAYLITQATLIWAAVIACVWLIAVSL